MTNTTEGLHEYQEGLHHKDVGYCPDCQSETVETVVELRWSNPADIVAVPAKACECNPTMLEKIKRKLNWVLAP